MQKLQSQFIILGTAVGGGAELTGIENKQKISQYKSENLKFWALIDISCRP